ncbi:hypothetical protein EG349_14345 [Chryseobacterium shandongense]|uniref:Uncharacterized protein n=1 Tax=Chryseobacterium shandongense TaxID=1493872 RepID=A0AAD0YF79_9FLAO|nr:hypothetical protein [Chryseobacterium shandongense]AZA87895.1 hypothetical protein EG349_14345 [Chryseobacterium shandongense]AZA96455.1 hypothetical protein EG353_13125 [Chryseobacterium shandongense]
MKNIFLLLTFLLSFTGLAQKIKLENFQLVSYDINSSNKVEFNSYSTIDRNGKLNVYIDGYKGKTYYSYQLSENEIKTVNDLDKENLESFVAKKHLDPNHGYAGSRNYISFQKNGKKKEICFILPFMNSEFLKILNSLEEKIYSQQSSAEVPTFNIDFNKLEKDILKQNQIDNYLPQKTLPPPPMSR